MPVHPTYPGVYVEEISSGLHTVSQVATSVAAFVGTFRKGPLNAPLSVLSLADFEREYGGLDRASEATYAVQQFFLNGGQQAWIVRVADTVNAPVAKAASKQVLLTDGNPAFTVQVGRRVSGASVSDPGAWGNALRVEIDYTTADPTTLFNLTVSEVQVDGDRTSVVQSETYRNLTLNPNTPNNAIEVVNQGSRLVQLDRTGLPAAVAPMLLPASNGTLGGKLASPPTIPADGATFNVDIGVATISGTISYAGAAAPTSYAQLRPFIQAAIQKAASNAAVPNGLKPLLAGASVDLIGSGADAHFFIRLGRGARPFDPTTIVKFTGGAAGALKLSGATVSANTQQYVLAAGSDGPPPAAGTVFRPIPLDAVRGSLGSKSGIYALENVDLFNILCIPEATTLATGDQNETRSLYTEAETYVEGRRAMLIVDIPASVTRLDLMQTWLADNDALRHPSAAVYFPRTSISDPLNQGRLRSLASSGTIAGLWARTDAQRGVWKAPAGTEAQLRNVASLDYVMTDLENGTLNPLGANCLRSFPVYSNICWGARTLDGADVLASDWKYVPVRRTTLFLEESLYRGTKWVVFEPNDEPLWSQIRLNIGAFMQDMFRQGAFQGTTPQQAYYVKCDNESTTQQDIDNGIVNIEVGFAPLKPAEFVVLKIRQLAPGMTA